MYAPKHLTGKVFKIERGPMSIESLHLKKDQTINRNHLKESRSTIWLGLILLLGLALRFYDLGAESYWIDEMSTVVEGQQDILELVTSGRLDQPPAYYFPFNLWVTTFGTSEISTRAFSALIGIGSIWLLYFVGQKLFGKTVGLIAAFLMAISEFQIYHSQQARFYIFFEFTALLSFLFFILVLENKRRIFFVLYGITSIAMIYSHAFGLFILAGQGLFLVLNWKRYKDILLAWFVCQAVIFIGLIPYFYPLVIGGVGGSVDTNIGGLAAPLLKDPIRSMYRFILSARGERSWQVMLINYSVAGAALIIGLAFYFRREGKDYLLNAARSVLPDLQEVPDMRTKVFLLSCWLMAPIVLPFIFSFVVGPMYSDRYTISAAPAFYLLLALGLFTIRKLVPIMISLGVLVIMIAPSLAYYYERDVHEQWDEAAIYVQENSNPNDVIVFAPNLGIGIQQTSFNWYYDGDLKECSLGLELVDPALISDTLEECISGRDRFWVVIRDNDTEPSTRYKTYFIHSNQPNMEMISEQQFVEISVYLFEITD